MGALTFKPYSFESRPWELTKINVPDFIDDNILIFHLRGSSLIKITSPSWIRDRVRFSYDGYRRQRLTHPIVNGNIVGWSRAIQMWWDLVYMKDINILIDPIQPYHTWLRYLLGRISYVNNLGLIYSIDVNRVSTIYHGSYGLECVKFNLLTLPVGAPYEELGVIKGLPGFKCWSLMVLQILKPMHYLLKDLSSLESERIISDRIACFQVSPLQRFLVS